MHGAVEALVDGVAADGEYLSYLVGLEAVAVEPQEAAVVVGEEGAELVEELAVVAAPCGVVVGEGVGEGAVERHGGEALAATVVRRHGACLCLEPAALLVGGILAWLRAGLFPVAIASCVTVFLTEWLMRII